MLQGSRPGLAPREIRYNPTMLEWSFDTQDELAARAARRDFARQVSHVYGADVDSMAAEIVLGELISNAVRYAPGRTRVQSSTRTASPSPCKTRKGFSPGARSADGSSLSESGRGLAIVSRLAQAIEIKCRAENGCCVRARLAIRRAS
jgi:anti-sigma regulatory factor (Ser/Thr protein kinase)